MWGRLAGRTISSYIWGEMSAFVRLYTHYSIEYSPDIEGQTIAEDERLRRARNLSNRVSHQRWMASLDPDIRYIQSGEGRKKGKFERNSTLGGIAPHSEESQYMLCGGVMYVAHSQ